jgi:hypothetical protein
MIQCILPEGNDKKKRKEGPGLNQGRWIKNNDLREPRHNLAKRTIAGERRRPPKTRLPFISPASFPELSSKIARFSFLPSISFLFKISPNPGKGEISPDPKIAKLLSFWKEWTDKYNSQ